MYTADRNLSKVRLDMQNRRLHFVLSRKEAPCNFFVCIFDLLSNLAICIQVFGQICSLAEGNVPKEENVIWLVSILTSKQSLYIQYSQYLQANSLF